MAFRGSTPAGTSYTGTTAIDYVDITSASRPAIINATDLTFHTGYHSGADAEYSVGSATGTLVNSATVSAGALQLNGLTSGHARYAGASNADSASTGTIRMKITPNYTGDPNAHQIFLHLGTTLNFQVGGNNSWIGFGWSNSSNELYLGLTNNGGSTIKDGAIGAWNPTSGQTYEFELNYDTSSYVRIFIDGVLFYELAVSYSRTAANVVYFVVGTTTDLAAATKFKVEEVSVFNTVKHTAGYTAPSLSPHYRPDGVALATGNKVLFRAVNDQVYTATVSGNNITWVLAALGQNTSGAPTTGDTYTISAGFTYTNTLWSYTGADFVPYTPS